MMNFHAKQRSVIEFLEIKFECPHSPTNRMKILGEIEYSHFSKGAIRLRKHICPDGM